MHLKAKLDQGAFVVLAEVAPPKGTDVSEFLGSAAKLLGLADALLVPDLAGAVMRMSALGAAVLLQQKVTDTVLQVCCRDRNRLALQADLLAASAHGITHLLVAEAEEPAMGDHPQARAVDDLQPLELLETVRTLQQGFDLAGRELSGVPRFMVGSTVRPVLEGRALKQEVEEVRRKAAAGAAYFVTPPIFDLDSLSPFLKEIEGEAIRIIPTVLVLKSVGMARYIDAHLDHIHLPPGLIERIQGAADTPRECVRVAAELVAGIRERGFSGVLLSAVGWAGRLPEVLGSVSIHGSKNCVGE